MTDKNPWGQGPSKPTNNNRPKGGSDIPDIDDLLKKAKDNFNFGKGGGDDGNNGKVILLGLLIIGFFWIASGVYRVLPQEDAVIQRFGALNRTQVESGVGYHFPWPIETMTKVNVETDRRLTIGFQGSGRTERDVASESLMLTSDANIVDIDVVVIWNIGNAHDFVFNIRAQESTIKRVAESTTREVIGQTALQPIITTGRENVAQRIQKLTQETLDAYGSGVAVKQVLIQDATVHPQVMEAFDDVVAATQDAERFQNEATIYKNDILPKARGEAIKMIQEAEGYKQARIARAEGDAERFNQLYDAYKGGRDVTRERIYIETMEQVLKNSDRTIIDQEDNAGILPYLPLGQKK